MSVKLDWIILCEKVITDDDSGAPSIINIFSDIEVKGFPAPLNCVLVLRLSGLDNTKHDFLAKFIAAREGVSPQIKNLSVESDQKHAGFILEIKDFQISAAGEYYFLIEKDGVELGRTSLSVTEKSSG